MTRQVTCSPFIELTDLSQECLCDATSEQVEDIIDGVSDVIAYLTNFAYFGVCEATVRPCRACWCGVCPGCCEIDAIPLRGPIISVTSVILDGETLDASRYQILPRDRIRLTPVDGHRQVWPGNQRLDFPTTEDNTFSITYRYGHDPMPWIVREAAIELTCDLLKALQPNSRGALPPNTTAAFFQGVTVSLQNRAERVRQGAGDLPKMSMLLGSIGGRQAGVFSVDGLSAWTFPMS